MGGGKGDKILGSGQEKKVQKIILSTDFYIVLHLSLMI